MKVTMNIAALCILFALPAFSQNDSTRYINGLPVTEDDTTRQFLQGDLEPKNKVTRVSPNAIPAELLKALNTESQYQGWKDSTVYFEANTGLYLIPIKTGEGVRIYGLDRKGNPVTFDEISRQRP